MSGELGVPVKDVIAAVINSYKKGFEDAIECLKLSSEKIDIEKMKQMMLEDMQKNGKIKAEW